RIRAAAPLVLAHVDAARVLGSRHDLSCAVANLLDNATRYAADKAEVSLRRDGAHAVLCVEDDGPGIPPPDRDRVFERFVRLDPGRGRAAGGAGLGLAVVRETASAHGGVATVTDSALGGARFVLELPLAP
ncbi:MAG TPA: ATP-binding protein, partial [Acidimicrobiales bacterium]|nr:ATP-binding protein [Acidimicrobiales bacterium]